MENLQGKKILLMISGGIAAYKSCELVRLFREAHAEVRVVMTDSATKFITPMTLKALSNNKVYTDIFEESSSFAHIELSRWCDVIVLAPATANRIAGIASGAAEDFVNTICLCSDSPKWIAPAMNSVMWNHPQTKKNLSHVEALGWKIINPQSGTLACGEEGEGKMASPETCVTLLSQYYSLTQIAGKKIVITAGPTYQPVDEVRFFGNRSSGKMGYALAQIGSHFSNDVVLISGPVSLPAPASVKRILVETADEMYQASMEEVANSDIFIGTAAVADYSPIEPKSGKLSKSSIGNTLTLTLQKTKDIIKEVALHHPETFMVGFCAQCHDLEDNARRKLNEKNLSMIIANWVGSTAISNCGFGGDENEGIAYWRNGNRRIEKQSKQLFSSKIYSLIQEISYEQSTIN